MSAEESRFYSLLLLRLSRTKASLSGAPPPPLAKPNSTLEGSDPIGGPFQLRDVVPPAQSPLGFHSLSKHTIPTSTISPETIRTTMPPTTVVVGEANGGGSPMMLEALAKMDSANTNDPAAATANKTPSPKLGPTRLHKDQVKIGA